MNTTETSIIEALWVEFGRRVRARREDLRLSQEQAAARISMTRQQWHRIEKGAGTKRETILRIAKAIELDANTVLSWAGYNVDLPEESKAPAPIGSPLESLDDLLLSYFHALPRDLQMHAIAAVAGLYQEAMNRPGAPAPDVSIPISDPSEFPPEDTPIEIIGIIGKG